MQTEAASAPQAFDGSPLFPFAQSESPPKHCVTHCSLSLSVSQMDHDPRNPTYISSQGPLPTTVADFWQVILNSSNSALASFTGVVVSFVLFLPFGLAETTVHKTSDNGRQSCTDSDIFCVMPLSPRGE